MSKIVTAIEELRRTSSGNDKLRILKRHDSPLLREVLKATYDPFKKYGIKKVPMPTKRGTQTIAEIWPQVQLLLDRLAEGHGSNQLKNEVLIILNSLSSADVDLLIHIIKKDLKAGISATTINKAFPGLVEVFGIMKAKTYKDGLWKPDLMGSIKLDGYRCLVRDDGLLSSGGFPIVGADHIIEQMQGLGNFDGEIKDPNTEFNEGGGDIRSARVTPNAKLFVFDYIDHPELPFRGRYSILEEIARAHKWSTSLANPATITLLRHRNFANEKDMKDTFGKALNAGFEGLVLKDPEGPYELKRSKYWLKLKPTEDEDCPIVGFYEGKDKYAGMLGGVTVRRANGHISKVGGGFSDHLRYEIWHNQEHYRGKMIEVHYLEDTPAGDFRHARFEKFRPDKD